MRRYLSMLLSVTILAGAMVVTLASAVAAGTQGSCPGDDDSKVRLWENAVGDTSDGNDSLWLCASDTNLGNNNHDLAGTCNRPWPPAENWNDCVTSWTIYVPANRRLCLYQDSGQETLKAQYNGPIEGLRYEAGSTWEDHLSGFAFTSAANCPDYG